MSAEHVIKEGKIYGGWRKPRNAALLPGMGLSAQWLDYAQKILAEIQAEGGNVFDPHDEEGAQKLGLRGGAIGANILINTFPPVLLDAFGQRWFERGSLSLYFRNILLDQEEMRAVMNVPPQGVTDCQVEAWMETPQGLKISEGTAAVGDPGVPTALKARKLDAYEPGEIRILAGMKAGDVIPGRDEVMCTQEDQNIELEYITDNLDWYKGNSPWGGAICTLGQMVLLMDLAHQDYMRRPGAGIYGAFEVRNVNGPVMVGQTYRTTGEIVYVGTSPQTEYYWYDSFLNEKDSGKQVAEMRCLIRKMKAGSPLWPEYR